MQPRFEVPGMINTFFSWILLTFPEILPTESCVNEQLVSAAPEHYQKIVKIGKQQLAEALARATSKL